MCRQPPKFRQRGLAQCELRMPNNRVACRGRSRKGEQSLVVFVAGVKLPQALAELGLIDEYEFVVQPRLAGHGPTLFAGLSKHVDLRLVSRLEIGFGAGAMRDEPRREPSGLVC